MAKRTFDKIMEGLDEARAYLDGTADKRRYRVHARQKPKVRMLSDEEERRVQQGIPADPENPEWTEEDFRSAKPFGEVFPSAAENRRRGK